MNCGNIIFSEDFSSSIRDVLLSKKYDKFFVLTDTHVYDIYHDFLDSLISTPNVKIIKVKEGDENKDIVSASYIWKYLSDNGASRYSCMINFGGGMITDIGGFAASTFKRGIDFVNVPTSLLAMVDASAGGKTAINFNGLKNEIGTFKEARNVIVDSTLLQTLDNKNFLSGYAEMLKHSLLEGEGLWAETINFDLNTRTSKGLNSLIKRNIDIKSRIVKNDPLEKGLRKVLNLGHTFGHAFEVFSYIEGRPILHGYAVAFGLICELYLSCTLLSFPTDKMHQTARFIHSNYGTFHFTCKDYEKILSIMRHDKKNDNDNINCSLLQNIGCPKTDCHITEDDIFEAFDFLREGV